MKCLYTKLTVGTQHLDSQGCRKFFEKKNRPCHEDEKKITLVCGGFFVVVEIIRKNNHHHEGDEK